MHREFMSNMAIATHLYDNAVLSPYGSQSWYDAGQIRNNGGDGSGELIQAKLPLIIHGRAGAHLHGREDQL